MVMKKCRFILLIVTSVLWEERTRNRWRLDLGNRVNSVITALGDYIRGKVATRSVNVVTGSFIHVGAVLSGGVQVYNVVIDGPMI